MSRADLKRDRHSEASRAILPWPLPYGRGSDQNSPAALAPTCRLPLPSVGCPCPSGDGGQSHSADLTL